MRQANIGVGGVHARDVGAVMLVMMLVEFCRDVLVHQRELFLLPMRGGNVLLYKLCHPHGAQLQ